MPNRFRLLLTCTLLPLVALLGASCSRQAGKERALARADAYYASGALDKAEVEYLNTLNLDHENARALAQLGLIYADQGRIGKAPGFLFRARKLQPDNIEVRARLAVFYLAAKKLDEARTELRYILEHQPDHADAPLLLAESAQQPKTAAETKEFLQKLSTARTAPVLAALATLELYQHKRPEAEALLKQALALDPKSAVVPAILGSIYLTQNKPKSAEESFRLTWDNSAVRSSRKLVYIRYKLQTGDVEGARRLLAELTTQAPDSLPPLLLLAEISMREKKYDESLALTGRILSRDPSHYPALMLSIRLRVAKGETDKALLELEKLRNSQPKNPEVFYQFGLTYLVQGDAVKAIASLNQAIDLSPGYVDAILLLADLNLKKGDAKAASAALKPLVVQHPELLPAKLLLARAYASQGDFDDALATYQAMAAAAPQDPSLLLPIALIDRQQKKYDEARMVLAKVLELAPDSGPAIEQLNDLDLMSGNTAGARQRAEALKARQPDKANSYLLLAKISLVEKNLLQAETDLLKVIELQPDTPAAYYLLAGVYNQTHQEKKALAQLEQLVPKAPKNPSLRMRIALLHEQLKEYPAAREAYEKVLALEPKFLPALNNLAYLYSEQFNELDQGLALAKRARELAPLDPHIADTLGWILYKQGQYLQAQTLLLESAVKSPNDPVVQFHLGMAQYMMGEAEAARLALRRALQLNPEFPDKTQVTQRLAILGADDTQAGPELRATLEKAVAERKDDPVALTRLGAMLEKAGELDQAQKNLNAALAINPHNVNAALSLIRVHLARHDTSKALDLAKATRKQAPDDPTVGHQLGRVAFQIGDYQWAASLLQESARKLPDDLEVLFDQAKAAYSIGRLADAEEGMRRIQQSNRLSPNAQEISRYLEMIELAAHPAPDGPARIDRVLAANPAFVPALMALGAKAEKELNAVAARQAYEKALAQYPDFIPAKRSLALLAAAAAESDPKAYDLAAQAREASPNDPELAQALGILAYRKGDFSRAASLMKESIARMGEDARRTYHLGMAQYRLKDSAARLTLQRSLELGLKDEAGAEVRRILAELK